MARTATKAALAVYAEAIPAANTVSPFESEENHRAATKAMLEVPWN